MESFSELELEDFDTELNDHIAIIRLNSPPVNAHGLDMLRELQTAVEAIRFDPEIRVALLGSAIEGYFSAGADISIPVENSSDYAGKVSQLSKEMIMKMRTTDKLFIAMVNGDCMGGGLELALACDFRFVGDDDEYNIGMPEIKLGLIAGEAGSQLLPRYIGRSEALRLMVTGEVLTPEKATEIGMFDELHSPDSVEDAAFEFAREISEKPNKAVGYNKLAVNEGVDLPLWDALAHERTLQNQLFDTPGAKEGLSAFFDKREPNFLSVEQTED